MMKCVFVFVLLHLCYSVGLNMDQKNEIRKYLNKLDTLSRSSEIHFTSPDTVQVPRNRMYRNATSCVGVFIRELRNLLNNVTEHQDVQTLKNILDRLEPHHEDDENCRMMPEDKGQIQNVFASYDGFTKRLNKKR